MAARKAWLAKVRQPGFKPSDLLEEEPAGGAKQAGSGLLSKADRLKAFVQQQNSRTGHTSAKKEWMLAAQQLQEEREAAERELQVAIQGVQSCHGLGEELQGAQAVWATIACASSQLRLELREQVKGIAAVHKSLRSYGVQAFSAEARAVAEEVALLREHLELQLKALAEEAASLAEEDGDGGRLHPSSSFSASHTGSVPSSAGRDAGGFEDGGVGSEGGRRGEGRGGLGAGRGDCEAGVSGRGEEVGGGGGGEGIGRGGEAGLSGRGAAKPSDLDTLLDSFPLVGAGTRARVREVYSALRGQHVQRMEDWRGKARGGAGARDAKAANWPDAEHLWFVSMREHYWREMAPKGASREALMRKLSPLMPAYTLPELLAHDDWHLNQRLLQRKRMGLLEGWQRERAQFFEDTAALLEEQTQMAVARAETAADRLVHELTRERVAEELQVLRAAAAEQAEAAAAARAQAEARAHGERMAADEEFHRGLAAKKELVAAYRQKLEQQEAARAAVAAAQAAVKEQAHAQQATFNKGRVDSRNAEYQAKLEQKRRDADVAAAEEQAREARLDKLRELVAPHVEADPARVLLPTESFLGVDEKVAGAFQRVHGYTVDQVYKDQRFKVMEALQSAGLHQTDYARHIILEATPAKPTRPDNLTAVQRGVA